MWRSLLLVAVAAGLITLAVWWTRGSADRTEAADPLAAISNLRCPPRAAEDWATFVATIGNLRYSEWPSDLERARLWYEPHLERIHEDADIAPASRRASDTLDG